jgi:hypothetical protein
MQYYIPGGGDRLLKRIQSFTKAWHALEKAHSSCEASLPTQRLFYYFFPGKKSPRDAADRLPQLVEPDVGYLHWALCMIEAIILHLFVIR